MTMRNAIINLLGAAMRRRLTFTKSLLRVVNMSRSPSSAILEGA